MTRSSGEDRRPYITGRACLQDRLQLRVGVQDRTGFQRRTRRCSSDSTTVVPNQLTLHARPFRQHHTHTSITVSSCRTAGPCNRLTRDGGLRYDYFHDFFPETPIGPADYAPNRNIVFPEDRRRAHGTTFSREAGIAYDVFGDGRTAVKVSLNKYMAGQAAIGSLCVRHGAGEPSGQHDEPIVERRQPQLRARLRSRQPVGER